MCFLFATSADISDETDCCSDSQCKAGEQQAHNKGTYHTGGSKGNQKQDPGEEDCTQYSQQHGVQCRTAAAAVMCSPSGYDQKPKIRHSDSEQYPIGYRGQCDGSCDL